MKTKICSKCNIEKELSEFHKDKRTRDGLQYKCKVCAKLCSKQYRIDNKEHIKECSKQYNIDNKEHIKQYRIDNKEYINECSKQYYIDNKEHLAKYHKQYRKDNHEIFAARRAIRKGWGTPQPINEYFIDAHLHHLHIGSDHQICIYIPVGLHRSIWHTNTRPETMIEINLACLKWYYGLTIKGI